MTVSVYTRESGTRQYVPANLKTKYPQGTAFVLRYTKQGKRKWDTVSAHNVHHAFTLAKLMEAKMSAPVTSKVYERKTLKDAAA
jgi:hypothetical protein